MFLTLILACSDQKLGTFNGEPAAEILSHVDGDAVVEGATVAFRGSASDPDDVNSTLTTAWYAGDTLVCAGNPDDDGATSCDVPIAADTVSVVLEVRDPDGASASDKVSLTVIPLAAPAVTIQSPASGAYLYTDLPVDLAATVTDPDDAADTLIYAWTSSAGGALPAGSVAADGGITDVSFLPEGTQTLTVTVTDDDGNVGNAEVGVTVGPPNSPPVPTITTPIDGDRGRLGDALLLDGTVIDVDQPEDSLVVSWSSDVDGALGASAPTSDGNVSLRVTLSTGAHVLTLSAADELGAVGSTSVVYTVSAPPTVVIDAPVDGEVVPEGETVSLVGTVSDDLDAPEGPELTWTSDRDGLLWSGNADGAGSVITARDDLSAGTHLLTLSATDSDGLVGTDTVSLRVNGLPSAPTVSISPDPATSADDLTATVDVGAVDPEGDPVSYTWTWLRNGVVSGASTSSSLPASATIWGEVWQVQVVPDDGTHAGPAGAASVTIGNAPPSLAGAAITPDPADAGDALTCTASGYADADGDADRSTIAWTVGATTIGTGATVTTGYRRGDLVTCTVTPFDGTDTGAPVTAALTIDNAPPAVSALAITPSSPGTNDTLSVSVSTADADGDAVALAYAWYVNGGLAGSSSTLAGTASFSRGDGVYVVVTPGDGTDTGAAATSATVTIANTAPTAPTVSISPASPTEGVDDLWCQVTAGGTDIDGDAISYTVRWEVDGVSFSRGSTTTWPTDTIDAADTAAGDRWTCTVSPTDGTTAGASATASVTIQAGDVDYSDTWAMDSAVSYTCAFGLVNFNFSSLTIVDGYPSISVRGSGNVGTMTGTFSSATDFTADNYLPGSCAETYTINGTFVDDYTLDATIDAAYVGSCFGCTSRSWTFTATR